MTKYPKFLQDSENSCGAYCIKMILNYFHSDDEIKNIKRKCRMTKEGITVYGLISALKQYHIEAKAYQCDFKCLYDELKVPAIIHLNQNGIYHYVVLYKMHEDYFLVGDPAKGLVKMTYEAFHEQFTGIVIMIKHVGHPVENIQSYPFSLFIKNHLIQHKQAIIKLMVKTLIISLLTLLFSFYYRLIIDEFANHSMLEILLITFLFIIVYVIKMIFDYYRHMNIIDLKLELNNQYITKTMQNLIYQDFSFFLQYEKGILLSRANHLFELSEYFIELYNVLFMDIMMVICTLIFLLYIHVILFLVSLLIVIFIFVVCFKYNEKIHLKNKHLLEYKERLNDGILEYQENFFQTIQFKLKKTMKNKIAYLYDEYFQQEYDRGNFMNDYQISIESLIQGLLILSIIIALYLFQFEIISIGTVILVYMLLSYLVEPLIHISSFLILNDEMKIIFDRYKEMMPDKKIRKKRIRKIRCIELKDVTFSYGYGHPIFEHLQFVVNHSFILKGKIGSGKSTFLKLLSGQLSVVKGQVLINQKDISSIELNSLYSRIKYLDKNPVFYNESLEFNMILDNKNNEDKMLELLHYFHLDNLIPCLKQNLDIKGSMLSSGQGQLIMIIRVLLTDIDILILDEAFSNVDEQRRTLLMDYLLKRDIIVIIVSHQINLMNNDYDCVIIEEGKLLSEENYGNRFSTH